MDLCIFCNTQRDVDICTLPAGQNLHDMHHHLKYTHYGTDLLQSIVVFIESESGSGQVEGVRGGVGPG